MRKNYFQTDKTQMKGKKSVKSIWDTVTNCSKWSILFLALVLLLPSKEVNAQITFTLGEGTESQTSPGITPFAMEYQYSRTQYLYYGQELLEKGAINGNIVSLAFNITTLGLPVGYYPENVIIKMKLTPIVVLGDVLIDGLPEYYSATSEVITTTGWHTFTLNKPFEWDGYSNILIEVCRSNNNIGTSFGIQTELKGLVDFRTNGLFTSENAVSGCSLTGEVDMALSDKRFLPNVQFTMTNPCNGVPSGGETVVSEGPYCNGTPFQLTISNGDLGSGLTYQWESSPNQNGPWNSIVGATSSSYETTQATSTYYRRKTTCIFSNLGSNSLGILVNGEGCYCTAEVLQSNSVGITNVTFNTINNTSPSNISYSNFTNIQTEVDRNSVYNLSARVTTLGGTNYTKAWIDWNQNGEYETNEGYDLGISVGNDVNSGLTQSVMIPADAVLGSTNMRIRSSQSSENVYPAACGPIERGEGEDYTLIISPSSLGVNQFGGLENEILVYKNQNGIFVEMQNENIARIKVYDLSGRLLINKKVSNEKVTSIDAIKINRQVLIFQITTQNGEILYKKQIL